LAAARDAVARFIYKIPWSYLVGGNNSGNSNKGGSGGGGGASGGSGSGVTSPKGNKAPPAKTSPAQSSVAVNDSNVVRPRSRSHGHRLGGGSGGAAARAASAAKLSKEKLLSAKRWFPQQSRPIPMAVTKKSQQGSEDSVFGTSS